MGRLIGIARRERKRACMESLERANISGETGVANDFRGKPGKRQVTVLSAEAWAAACSELGRQLPWTTRRANLLVEGVELPKRCGDIIEVGDVRLRVTMEVAPCNRMQEQCSGLRAALTPEWRGGVACEVLQGGPVRIGDCVSVLISEGR